MSSTLGNRGLVLQVTYRRIIQLVRHAVLSVRTGNAVTRRGSRQFEGFSGWNQAGMFLKQLPGARDMSLGCPQMPDGQTEGEGVPEFGVR